MERKRRIEDSLVEQIYMIRPEHLNGADRVFGGKILSWIDEVAALVAIRHCQGKVTTVAIDNLRFKRGAYKNDIVVLIGKITCVGHTSMEVRVDSYVENLKGMRSPINRAYVTVVALDDAGKPTEVPGILIETESQKAEWEAGKKRQKLRKERHEGAVK